MKTVKQNTKITGLNYRRGEGEEVVLKKKWGRMSDAVACSSLNRTEIYRLIREGLVESFVYKFREDATSGSRLINLESLLQYMDKRAAEAAKESAK